MLPLPHPLQPIPLDQHNLQRLFVEYLLIQASQIPTDHKRHRARYTGDGRAQGGQERGREAMVFVMMIMKIICGVLGYSCRMGICSVMMRGL